MGYHFAQKNKFTFKKESVEELKVKEYIKNYIKELQRHFNVPNKKMRIILLKIYKELSPLSAIKIFTKKMLNMIKSNYKNIAIKRK